MLKVFNVGTTGRAYSITGGYTGVRRNPPLQASSFPFVSGAHAIDTTVPINKTAASISIVGDNPNLEINVGSRKVPSADPIRLHAVATPTPDARNSVGKLSAE
nr:hypothetical protein [Niallia nealsonii]